MIILQFVFIFICLFFFSCTNFFQLLAFLFYRLRLRKFIYNLNLDILSPCILVFYCFAVSLNLTEFLYLSGFYRLTWGEMIKANWMRVRSAYLVTLFYQRHPPEFAKPGWIYFSLDRTCKVTLRFCQNICPYRVYHAAMHVPTTLL